MSRRLCLSALLLVLTVSPVATFAQPFPIVIGRNFEGTTSAIQAIPPDTMGAAGIDYFVELNNDRFKVFRKSDGTAVQDKGINQFWLDANTSPLMKPFDPRVVYDPHARRWYAVAADSRQNANNILFAISSSSDPTQPWHGFSIDSDTDDSNWADFPMLGYNLEGVWISAFMPTLGAAPSRSSFIGLPKLDLLQPVPSTANAVQFEDVDQGTAGTHPQLAIDTSPFGGNMSVLAMSSFGGGSLVRAEVGLSSPQVTNVGSIFVAAAQPPSVVQPGAPAVQDLHSNDWRFSSNALLLNGHIYAVQAIDDAGRAAVRYLRVDAATNAVIESTVIGDPNRAYTFPSIAVNEFGDIIIGATGTSTTEFASSYALVRRAGSAVFDTLLLRAGVDNYVKLDSQNRNRWGDYSATTIDPADPGIVWTNQEFVAGTNRWATQATELILPQPDEARWAEPLSGMFDDPTLWLTAHGAAPLPSDQLVFSRATDPVAPPITISLPQDYVHPTASFRQGNVRLDLGGNHLDLLLHLEVGPYFGHPQATVANGTITSVIGAIAPRPTSEGHLTLDNAQWNVAGDVIVGSASAGTVGFPGEFGGTGSLTIDNNSQLTVGNTLKLWQLGTVNLSDGVLTTATIDSNFGPRNFNFTGGTLHVDTFAGELVNDGGTLAPGSSFGTTNVLLSYTQLANSMLEIEIGGTAPADFDRLIVGGPAQFGGELDVNLVAGYLPNLSDTFEIVTASLIPVQGYALLLANSTLPSISQLLDFHLFYEPTALTLAVVPALDGDYNANGAVDAADYTVWQDTLGATGIGLAADGNLDGLVNLVDLALWRINFGAVAPGSGSAVNTSEALAGVPEPHACLLACLATAGLCALRRRSIVFAAAAC